MVGGRIWASRCKGPTDELIINMARPGTATTEAVEPSSPGCGAPDQLEASEVLAGEELSRSDVRSESGFGDDTDSPLKVRVDELVEQVEERSSSRCPVPHELACREDDTFLDPVAAQNWQAELVTECATEGRLPDPGGPATTKSSGFLIARILLHSADRASCHNRGMGDTEPPSPCAAAQGRSRAKVCLAKNASALPAHSWLNPEVGALFCRAA